MTEAGGPHRAWIEVDHDAIRQNLAVVRDRAPGARIIAVVKANAYGHGDVAVARTLEGARVEVLAVATVDEGARLRAAGIGLPILVLWGVGPTEAAVVARDGLDAVVGDERSARVLADAAAAARRRIGVHLKVDTGLGRQGAAPDEVAALAVSIGRSRDLRLVGTMTHLAVPGEDDAYTETQLLRMARALDAMRSAGIDPGTVHVSATGSILAGGPEFADAVRPGLMLYGMAPEWIGPGTGLGLRPALSLKARALRVFDVAGGAPAGYGLRWRAPRETRMATLGIGYGDGWPRAHANNGWALLHGERVPIVGAISMDGLTVEIGEVAGVTYGDEFVLIGEQEGARITAEEVAAERRTINYEVTTALRGRLPRLHLGAA
jgi:alanine racemase